MKYVGLTDDLEERKTAHGNPSDWWHRTFTSDREAKAWLEELSAQPGYTGGMPTVGCKFGYTYTITSSTKQ